LLVGDPDPAVAVAGQVGPGLEPGRVGDGQLAVALADVAEPDVVVALVVGVPGDMDAPLAVGGDGRAPVVGRARRDDPRLAAVAPSALGCDEDLVVVVAPALPGEPDGPLRIGRGHDVEVRALRIGDADDVGPGPLLFTRSGGRIRPADDLPVAVERLRPGD